MTYSITPEGVAMYMADKAKEPPQVVETRGLDTPKQPDTSPGSAKDTSIPVTPNE